MTHGVLFALAVWLYGCAAHTQPAPLMNRAPAEGVPLTGVEVYELASDYETPLIQPAPMCGQWGKMRHTGLRWECTVQP